MTKFGTKVLLFIRAQIIPSDFSTKSFFSFMLQNLSGDSAVSSTVDPMITKRSKVKTEAEGLRPLSPCSPVRVRNNKKQNSEEFITSVLCFYSYFIIICSVKNSKCFKVSLENDRWCKMWHFLKGVWCRKKLQILS